MLFDYRGLRFVRGLVTVLILVLLFPVSSVCLAADNLGRGEGVPHRVMKFAVPQKTRLIDEKVADSSPLRRPSRWQVTQVTGKRVRAFMKGSWAQMASGSMTERDFQPVSPPDFLAGLGLATLDVAETAGWFLAAGRRIGVKTTDPQRGFPTYSYESLARMAWGVGITRGTVPTARAYWDAGDEAGKSLDEFLASAVNEDPHAKAWVVAAHVQFEEVRGQALSRSPARYPPMNSSSDRNDPTRSHTLPQRDVGVSGLIVALVVNAEYGDSKVARELEKRFFPPGEKASLNGLLTRAHYALFRPKMALGPLPVIEPALPYQRIWNYSPRDEHFPQLSTVRKILDGTIIAEANVSVWALDSLGPYDLYQPAELVDLQERDPSIMMEQMWATANTFVGEPIYEKPRLLLRKEVAEKVLRINARLKEQGFRLKIFDAYRPFSVTQRLARLRPEDQAKGYLASANTGSRHNRGAALDLTIVNMAGDELIMPSAYLCFNEDAHRVWTHKIMPPAETFNVEYLTNAMATEGFTAINEEWWHYDAPGWEAYPVLDRPLWPGPDYKLVTSSEPVIRDLNLLGSGILEIERTDEIFVSSTVSTTTSLSPLPRERVERRHLESEAPLVLEAVSLSSGSVVTMVNGPPDVVASDLLVGDVSGLSALGNIDTEALPRYVLIGVLFLFSAGFAWFALRQMRA